MRNLIQIRDRTWILDPIAIGPCLALDSASCTCYYPYQDGIAARRLHGHDNVTIRIPVTDLGIVVDLQYLPEREAVCAISASGTIRLVPVHSDDAVQVVGVFDDGVRTASWSPDRERCVISDRSGRLTILSADWDLIDEIDTSSSSSSSMTISWRGDSARFVALIGSVLHLFDRNGVALARSLHDEFQHDTIVAGAVAYRPSGDLITVAVDHDAGSDGVRRRIALIEGANCLRHGDWALPETGDGVRALAWSADSAALAVAFVDRVIVFERHNYRWYAKSELRLKGDDPILIRWDSNRDLRLYLRLGQQRLRRLDFAHDVDRSDHGLVAVIDGCRILATDFAAQVVPPPMSAWELMAPAPVIAVAWSSGSGSGPCLAALTCSNQIALFEAVIDARFGAILSPNRILDIDDDDGDLRQITWDRHDRLVVLLRSSSDHDAVVIIGDDVRDRSRIRLPSDAIRVGRDGVQLEGGSVHLYEDAIIMNRSLPSSCAQFHQTASGDLIGLDWTGRLFLNQQLMAQTVSSYLIVSSSNIILFITTGAQHVLQAIDLNQDQAVVFGQRHLERGAMLVAVVPGLDRVVLQMQPRGSLETIYPRALLLRSIATLIGHRQWSSAFHCMRRHRLDLNLLYDADPIAFTADIDAFVAQIDDAAHLNEFVAALVEHNTRDTIYPEFRPVRPTPDDDVADHDYERLASLAVPGAVPLPDRDEAVPIPIGAGKINHICRLLDGACTTRPALVLARLGALLKLSPPDYDRALRLIAARPVGSDRTAALRFVVSVVDVDVLFDAALGLYDFDLVRMVGRVSDRDPNEYLGLIRDLSAGDSIQQRISIDQHLGRYDRVLHHLHEIDPIPIEAIIDLLRAHPDLYPLAFRLFPGHDRILAAYADSDQCPSESGLVLMAAGHRDRALQAFRHHGDWRQALNLAYQLDGVDPVALARDLAQDLTGSDAAALYLDICDDVDNAVRVLCQDELWAEAELAARRRARPDLVGARITPMLAQAGRRHLSDLVFARERLRYCLGRLHLLQQSAITDDNDGDRDGAGAPPDERFDLQTQTETNLSAYTLTSQVSIQSWASTPWSNISSVGRRQGGGGGGGRKRSQQRMREGDAREPAFLRKQVQMLAPDSDRVRKISSTIRALVVSRQFMIARQLQSGFDALLKQIREARSCVPDQMRIAPMLVLIFIISVIKDRWNLILNRKYVSSAISLLVIEITFPFSLYLFISIFMNFEYISNSFHSEHVGCSYTDEIMAVKTTGFSA